LLHAVLIVIHAIPAVKPSAAAPDPVTALTHPIELPPAGL